MRTANLLGTVDITVRTVNDAAFRHETVTCTGSRSWMSRISEHPEITFIIVLPDMGV